MRLWTDHKRKILAGVSALVLAIAIAAASLFTWITSPEFESLLAENVVRWIEERTGLRAELANFELEFRNQRLTLAGLVLRGEEDPSDPPLATIGSIRIGFSWRALISRRVVLSSLEIVEPRLRLEIGENGDTNMPAPPEVAGTGEAPPFALEIGDLSVTGGELSFDEERVRIDFRLSDFGGTFDYAETTGILSGDIEYTGTIAREDAAEIPYRLTATFDYADSSARILEMHMTSDDVDLDLAGDVVDVFGSRNGTLAYTGAVGLPFMNHFVTEHEFGGTAEVDGRLQFSTTEFRTEGAMTADALRFDRWTATNVSSGYGYAFPGRILDATQFEATAFDGQARGDLRLDHNTDPVRTQLDIDFNGIDLASLRELYPWDAPYVVGSRARGTMAGWFDGAFEDFDLSGRAVLTASDEDAAGGDSEIHLAVAGTSDYAIRPGNATLDGFSGAMGSSVANGSAVFGPDSFRITIDARSDDLSELAFVYPDANGSGSFVGEIQGSNDAFEAEGDFAISDFSLMGRSIDQATGRGRWTPPEAEFEGVEIELGPARVRLDGSWDIATMRPGPNLDVSFERVTPDLLSGFIDIPIDGTISGDGRLTSIEPLAGSGTLEIGGLVFEGRALGDAEVDLGYDGSILNVREARLERDDVLITTRGTYEPATDRVEAELEVRNQEIADLHWLGIPDDVGGRIESGNFLLEGTRTSPLASGSATIAGLRFRQQELGNAAIEVEHRNDRVVARLTAEEQVSAEVEIDTTAEDFPFSGTARFEDYDAARLSGLRPDTVLASGIARFEGELSDLSTLRGSGEVSALTAFLETDTLFIERPFRFTFDTTRIGLESLDLSNETTEVFIEGTILLVPEVPLDLSVDGRIDLALVRGPNIPFDTSGTVSIAGSIQGTIDDPDLSGVATLEDVSVSHPDLFVGLSDLNGDMFFNGNTVNLNDLVGTAGGGSVTVRGNVAVDGFGPGLMDVRLDASNVRVRTPEGLRAVFDGAALLRGTPDAPTLEGSVNITSLSFADGFEQFLSVFSASGTPRAPGPLDSLGLAIHVEGDENIRIENSLVGVDVRLNLDVAGTAGEPSLTGYVESTTGTLDLQGTRYRITRGNVSFIDPIGIDPIVDLQAETEIRNYRIILTISGRASDPRLDMRSDPALPQLEIVSLMAGGRTREEVAEGTNGNAAAAPTSEELFQSASATILTDLLAERVGSRFGLLNRVRIDPFLVGAENDPVARVTISEQITSNLEITYAQDLSSNRQQIILIEYFLDDGTSFVASRDETGAVGLDLHFRKRFR